MRARSHGDRSRGHVLQALVDTYDGDTHQVLTDLAALLGASVAYVDRATVEAHPARTLSAAQWAGVAEQLPPMAFDEHVVGAGTLRTDWIDDVLARADVPGRRRTADRQPADRRPATGCPGARCERHPHLSRLRLHRPLRHRRARRRPPPAPLLRQAPAGR